jgi:hypothetical protein
MSAQAEPGRPADASARADAGGRPDPHASTNGAQRLDTLQRQNRMLSEQVRLLSEHVRFLSEQLQTVARELETVHHANRRLLRRYFVFRPLALARKAVGITKDKSAQMSREKKLGAPAKVDEGDGKAERPAGREGQRRS